MPPPNAPTPSSAARLPPSRAVPLALGLLLAVAISAAGALSYEASADAFRAQKERELAALASLKADQLERWREERVADGEAIATDSLLAVALGDPLRRTDAMRAEIAQWFSGLLRLQDYRAVAVVGLDGAVRHVTGASADGFDAPEVRDAVRRALSERRAVFSDLRADADGGANLHVVAPVFAPAGAAVGAVVLRIDPGAYLFRMIQSWPAPSATSETMLVRAEGDHALVLNELRHRGGTALALALPAATGDPAIAAARGETGVTIAHDYRGKEVLAAYRPVPTSPWGILVKVDTVEAFAPLRERSAWAALAVIALVAAGAAGAALWWRGQTAAFDRQRFLDEAERAALARKLEHLTRYARDLVFVTDERNRILEANERALSMLGYTREELLGMSVRELRDPATVGDFDERVRQELEDQAVVFETRYRRKDGSTFPVEVSVHTDAIGGRLYFQGIARDITERKRAEEALRASEAKFRAAFEGASLGIALVERDGRLVEANRALCQLLGYSEDELRGRSVAELSHPYETADALARLANLRDGTAGVVELERRLVRKDGTTAETKIRVNPLTDVQGGRFALAVVEDVSEKKRLEAQLVLADRLASLGTLAAGVAHEINNPLSFVLSNLEFALSDLGQGSGNPDVVAALEDAREGGTRVREIVRDLKTFSRADGGPEQRVDVSAVVRSALALAANELRHKAQLVIEEGEVPAVLCSEHRLGQVVLNLLINAAQALPEGNAVAHVIRVATGTAGDGRAWVEVSDTGAGIPREVLPRIFDPFFTTKPVGVGTGLGLSICHGIVSSLGGEITVDSAPGQGSSFRVLLPPADRVDGPPGAQPAAARAAASARVLVVDDEPLVARAVQRILSPPYDVVAQTSARAALVGLEGGAPEFDLVLCDLMMPDMTGMELFERLSRAAPTLAARMVFLTGGAFTTQAREFLDRVPNPRVEKPFEPTVLRELVARLVRR